jgi:hypothetical protein
LGVGGGIGIPVEFHVGGTNTGVIGIGPGHSACARSKRAQLGASALTAALGNRMNAILPEWEC